MRLLESLGLRVTPPVIQALPPAKTAADGAASGSTAAAKQFKLQLQAKLVISSKGTFCAAPALLTRTSIGPPALTTPSTTSTCLRIREIGIESDACMTFRKQRRQRGLDTIAPPRHETDLDAFGKEAPDTRQSDAPAAAGHEHMLAAKPQIHDNLRINTPRVDPNAAAC